MKKFMVLYMAPVGEMDKMMQNSTPEDRKRGMDEWKKWGEAHKDLFVDMGAPLGKNMRVTKDGASIARNDVGGYSIVQAESQEAAAALLKDSPHFQMPGAYIEVMEWVPMQ